MGNLKTCSDPGCMQAIWGQEAGQASFAARSESSACASISASQSHVTRMSHSRLHAVESTASRNMLTKMRSPRNSTNTSVVALPHATILLVQKRSQQFHRNKHTLLPSWSSFTCRRHKLWVQSRSLSARTENAVYIQVPRTRNPC